MCSAVSPDLTSVARLFHALSDPIRVEAVELLRNGERCVCELMDELEAAQSRLSFHLKVLKEAGLVTDRREGRWIYYTLNRETLGELGDYVASLKRVRGHSASKSTTCCG